MSKILSEVKMQRESDYLNIGYDYKGRFTSYWYQIKEVTSNLEGSGKILEIGPGNRFMTDYLLKRSFHVETLDIDEVHAPDHVGSILGMPLPDQSFEVVAGFQILEHLPFEKFSLALKEMGRVARKKVLFSVPDVRYFIEIDISFFSSKLHFHTIFSFPRLTNRALPPTKVGGHLWEIGRPGFSLKKVLNEISNSGLKLEAHYRIPNNPIHHMFVMSVEKP